MKQPRIDFAILCVVVFSFAANGSKYTFELNVVEQITEENEENSNSRACELLVKAKKLQDVCEKLVNTGFRRYHMKLLHEELVDPMIRITMSSPSRDAIRKIVPACKCPTDPSIYLTDSQLANTIMIVTTNTQHKHTRESTPNPPKKKHDYIRYLKLARKLRKLRKKKKKRHSLVIGTENEEYEDGGGIEEAGAEIDSGILEGIMGFFENFDFDF